MITDHLKIFYKRDTTCFELCLGLTENTLRVQYRRPPLPCDLKVFESFVPTTSAKKTILPSFISQNVF